MFKSSSSETASNDNYPLHDLRSFSASRFDNKPQPIEWLVEHSIEHAIPGIIPAMGDTGKSFLMLELCRRVAYGESRFATPIFGGPVVREGSAVFITAEDSESTVHRRICAIDPKEARRSANGERLIVVPLPSYGGPQAFWKEDRKGGLTETDDFKRFVEALHKLGNVQLVCIDPLASFSQTSINDDPAAGQFVCSSLAGLAASLDATILTAHHMRKRDKNQAIKTLGDARDAIRGTTALVDGMRMSYALWPVEEDQARKVCKELHTPYAPNSVVQGGVVKVNGPASRLIATYVRDRETGLLIDCSAQLRLAAPEQLDCLPLLRVVIADAASDGQPYTKTGLNGVFARRAQMPVELRVSRHKLEGMVEELLDQGEIVACLGPKSTTIKWLDVPGGRFATGNGYFREGFHRGAKAA